MLVSNGLNSRLLLLGWLSSGHGGRGAFDAILRQRHWAGDARCACVFRHFRWIINRRQAVETSCIAGLVQDCSNSIANALELLQSYTKPSLSWQLRRVIAMFVPVGYAFHFCVGEQHIISRDIMPHGHLQYGDVIMSVMTFQITSLTIVCATVCWAVDQRKHQSSTSLVLMRWIHRWPVNSPHKGPVTRKIWWRYHVAHHVLL